MRLKSKNTMNVLNPSITKEKVATTSAVRAERDAIADLGTTMQEARATQTEDRAETVTSTDSSSPSRKTRIKNSSLLETKLTDHSAEDAIETVEVVVAPPPEVMKSPKVKECRSLVATTTNSVLSTTEEARPAIATTSRTTMREGPAIKAKDAPTEETVDTEEATMDPATMTTKRNPDRPETIMAARDRTSAHPAPVTTTTTKAVKKECSRIAATKETTEANSRATPVAVKDKKGNLNSSVSRAKPDKNIEAVAVETAETVEIEALAATTRMLRPVQRTTPKTTAAFP